MSAEGEKYNIFLTPAIMVDDRVISSGKGISEKIIEKAVGQAMGNV